jgi:hypothetical protein
MMISKFIFCKLLKHHDFGKFIVEPDKDIVVKCNRCNHLFRFFTERKDAYMALNKNLIEPLMEWKFIGVEKIGSRHIVSLTDEGINALRFLHEK